MPACGRCGHDNPNGQPTCAGCGTALLPDGGGPRMIVHRNPPMPRGGGSVWVYPPSLPIAWREPLSADPTEHHLLAAVRATPSDEGARMVYADWLEQRGRGLEAQFVRHVGKVSRRDPIAQAGDVAWRRLTCRGEISLCGRTECPGRWDLLEAERHDEQMRACRRCQGVRYVASADEATTAGGAQGCPIVIDSAADPDDLESAYKLARVRSELGRSRPLPR